MAGPEFMIVAGEPSGDAYGADLVHHILELHPDATFYGMGGDRMRDVGVELVHHLRDVSVMGFVEVVARLGPIYRAFTRLVEAAARRKPAAVIFIDYPDFNLRLAPKVKQVCDARTIYYIGPTVWAWRRGRVDTIKQSIDRMVVIFPFEEPIYKSAGVDVSYVGHPLVGGVRARRKPDELRAELGLDPDKPIVALLPGSRSREVAEMLPILQQAGALLEREVGPLQLVCGLADNLERADLEKLLRPDPPVVIAERATHDLMRAARLLLVACGTAPLEGAILGTPMVVVYKTSPLTFGIASRLVSVPHACMVNLILERRAVPELLQNELDATTLAREARRLFVDGDERTRQKDALQELRLRLGASGAAKRAARSVLEAAGFAAERPSCGVV